MPGQLLLLAYLALSVSGVVFVADVALHPQQRMLPAGKLVEQYYRTDVAIFKVGGPWLGRTLLHPRVDLAFHYAQWKRNVDLELVSPETLLPATTVRSC